MSKQDLFFLKLFYFSLAAFGGYGGQFPKRNLESNKNQIRYLKNISFLYFKIYNHKSIKNVLFV